MDKHLFLDLDEVAATHNVEQRVCEATKHPANPVLPVGRLDEWDAVRASVWSVRTVLYDPDDGLFKCWYTGADQERLRWRRMGYAYSEDGIRWIKPKLGLFEFNGSKDNNICLDMLGRGDSRSDGAGSDPPVQDGYERLGREWAGPCHVLARRHSLDRGPGRRPAGAGAWPGHRGAGAGRAGHGPGSALHPDLAGTRAGGQARDRRRSAASSSPTDQALRSSRPVPTTRSSIPRTGWSRRIIS